MNLYSHRGTTTFSFAILSLSITCLAMGCKLNPSPSGDDEAGLAAFSKDSLAAHIRVLSSDSFQGRRPFTPGETRTVDWLQHAFANTGLEPGNGGSYLQEVPLVEISPVRTPSMQLETPKGTVPLENLKDFVIWTERPDSVITLDAAALVCRLLLEKQHTQTY